MLLRNKLSFIIFFLNDYFKIDSHLLQYLQRKQGKEKEKKRRFPCNRIKMCNFPNTLSHLYFCVPFLSKQGLVSMDEICYQNMAGA